MKKKIEIEEINVKYRNIIDLINQGQFDIASKKVIKLYYKSSKINYTKGINLYYKCKIYILFYTFQNHEAIPYVKHLIQIYIKENDKKNLATIYKMYGVILQSLNDSKNAKYYLYKALELHKEIPDNDIEVATTYASISEFYFKKKEFSNSLDTANIALEILKDDSDINWFYLTMNKTKICLINDEIEEAKQMYSELLKSIHSQDEIETNQLRRIEVYFLLKKEIKDSAYFIQLIHLIIKTSIENSEKELTIEMLTILKDYHFGKKDFDLVYKYANQIIKINKDNKNRQVSIMHLKDIRPVDNIVVEDKGYELFLQSDLHEIAAYQKKYISNNSISKKININGLYTPSKTLSGDYIGFFNLCENDNYYLFVLADVVGKGITASYISFMLDGIIKSIIYNTDSFQLKGIIKDVNTILADSLNKNGFVSLWAGIIDIEKQEIESINAGHNPTFLVKNNGEKIELSEGSTVLGMFEILPEIKTEVISFEKGDSIIAYSDGVTEKMNAKEKMYEEDFLDLIDRYAKKKDFNFIKHLEAGLNLYEDKTAISDDISCLLIEYKE